MPYTLKELENNPYFQEMENAEYVEYEYMMEQQRIQYSVSGSNPNGTFELRDNADMFISYEDPETQLGKLGPWQEVVVSNRTPNIKTGETRDLIIDREIREL